MLGKTIIFEVSFDYSDGSPYVFGKVFFNFDIISENSTVEPVEF